MSAPKRIDVMGRLASMALRYDEWEDVHDAVAELIEAAEGFRAVTAGDDAGDSGHAACKRLDAALARCGGDA